MGYEGYCVWDMKDTVCGTYRILCVGHDGYCVWDDLMCATIGQNIKH